MFFDSCRLWRKLQFRLRRERLEQELAEEIELHAQLSEAALGDESRRAMGNITLAKEESRDMWSFLSVEDLMQDIRFAVRVFRKNLGFSSVAILSLALGIAGNTAIFSILNALLIRPLPFPQPDRLVRITELYPKAILDYFRQHTRTMDIGFVGPGSEMNLTGQGPAARINGSEVSANFFSVLRVAVERGRAFEPGEDRPGKDSLVILSHEMWRTRFNQDPGVIGSIITIAGVNRQVIGIAPADFAFPSTRVQAWIPTRIDPGNQNDYWGGAFVPLIARLRPGVSMEQAGREIHSLAAGIWNLFPWPMPKYWNADSRVITLQSDLAGETRSKLFVLLGAVGAVLVIACSNVASLLLARATTRRKEIAMRAALGAGGFRIIRQLLTESVVLALTAGLAGLLLGSTAISLFSSVVPSDMPGIAQIGTDWRVAAFAVGLSVLAGLSFGIVPALNARSMDLVEAMKSGSQRSTTNGWMNFRSGLIAGEIALTLVLLVGAGLLIQSLYDLTAENPGFISQQILTVKISPNESFCARREACVAFYSHLLERVRSVRGVMDAAMVNTVPLDGELPSIAAEIEDHPRTPNFPSPMLWSGAITPNYLRLMQIPLLSGRQFTEADGPNAPPVILVSASTARRFWPHGNPIGKHIKKRDTDTGWRTIVGVVADVKQFKLGGRPVDWLAGAMYMPYAQAVQGDGQIPAVMHLLVKTAAGSASAASEIHRIAVGANPNIPVSNVQTLTGIVRESISGLRSTIWVFLCFAAVALILAAVGLYGLMSYSVSQRTYEISVRMAIGAQRSSVVNLILTQGLRVTVLGLLIGTGGSFLLTRFLGALLFGVAPRDPLTFAGVSFLLMAVAVAASSIPAWRAARIDPIRTLRAE